MTEFKAVRILKTKLYGTGGSTDSRIENHLHVIFKDENGHIQKQNYGIKKGDRAVFINKLAHISGKLPVLAAGEYHNVNAEVDGKVLVVI